MSEKNTDNLIDELTQELEPVKCMVHPLRRVVPWLVGVVMYVVAIVHYIGLRPDFYKKFEDLSFLFENAMMALVAVSAALSASWMCVPDMRGQKWLISAPFSFLFVFLTWVGLRGLVEGVNLPSMHIDHCMADGFWMAVIPAALLVFITTRGATTRPILTALMTALSVSAFGYIGLRFTCMMDTIGHATIYHLVPFVLFGAVLGLLARRVYRW